MSWRVIFRDGIEFPLTKMKRQAAGIHPVRAGDASPTGNVPAQCYDEKNWEETNALNNKIHHRRFDAVRAWARHFAGGGCRLPGPSGQDRGAVRARRTDRRNGAADRTEAVGQSEAAVLHRKS